MQKIIQSAKKKKIPDVLKVIGSILILLSVWAWAAGISLGDIIFYLKPGIHSRYYLTQRRRISMYQMKNIDWGLYGYKKAIGKYPSTSEGLNALMVNLGNSDRWKGPYLNKADLNDPWGYPYRYTVKADGGFDLHSFGADGRPGGTLDNRDLFHQNMDWE